MQPAWLVASLDTPEISVLRENTVERRVHDIICGCRDESGIVVDPCSLGFIQPNRSADVAYLIDLK
jgi:hypothetical protein